MLPAADVPPIVRMGEYFYRPARIVVRAGDRVRFRNAGRLEHTVKGRGIRPRLLGRGDAQTVTFRRAGTVRYVCTLHPTRMRGVVVVKR